MILLVNPAARIGDRQISYGKTLFIPTSMLINGTGKPTVLTTFINSSLGDLLGYLRYLRFGIQTKAMAVKLVFGRQSVGWAVEMQKNIKFPFGLIFSLNGPQSADAEPFPKDVSISEFAMATPPPTGTGRSVGEGLWSEELSGWVRVSLGVTYKGNST